VTVEELIEQYRQESISYQATFDRDGYGLICASTGKGFEPGYVEGWDS
jgi:hypothetical protein